MVMVVMTANVTNVAMKDLPFNGPKPAFEIWRERIKAGFVDG